MPDPIVARDQNKRNPSVTDAKRNKSLEAARSKVDRPVDHVGKEVFVECQVMRSYTAQSAVPYVGLSLYTNP